MVDATAQGTIVIGDDRLHPDDLRAVVASTARRYAGTPVIAVVAEPTMRAVIAILAGIEAGSTVIPMSPDAGPRERDHVLADSGANLLVDASGDHDLAPDVGRPAPSVPLVLYTSGTTGPPKGVPLTRAAIRSCLDGLAEAWAWTPDDVLVHGLPLHHVHGLVLGVLGPLHVGSGLHHTGRPTAGGYAAARGSLYFGVPTVWSRISADRAAAEALRGARLLVSGSAALPAPVFDALLGQCGQAPVERYGMTETLITLAARSDEPRLRGSVGRPLPGIEVRVLDEEGGQAPARRGRCPRGPRPVGLRRLPAPPRCHRRLVHRRGMVPDRRRGSGRCAGSVAHRGPGRHRPDQERRLPHRSGRGGGRPPLASRGGGGGRDRCARRRTSASASWPTWWRTE